MTPDTPQPSLLQQASEWISLAQPVIWALILWGWWSLKKIFVRQSDCVACHSEIERRQGELANRLAEGAAAKISLVQKLDSLPTVHDLHRLENGMTEISGELKRLNAEVGAVQRGQDYLREQFSDLLAPHIGHPK